MLFPPMGRCVPRHLTVLLLLVCCCRTAAALFHASLRSAQSDVCDERDTMAFGIPWRVGYHGMWDTMACGIPWRVGHHAGYVQSDSRMWFPTAGDHRFTTTVGPISYGWKYTAVSERIGHFLADPFPSSSPAQVGAPASSSPRFRPRSFSA